MISHDVIDYDAQARRWSSAFTLRLSGGSVARVAETPPPVAIVGAGAVAQALGRLIAGGGAAVVALSSRNRSRAEHAARFIGGPGGSIQIVELSEVPRLATHVLIAVSHPRQCLFGGTPVTIGDSRQQDTIPTHLATRNCRRAYARRMRIRGVLV